MCNCGCDPVWPHQPPGCVVGGGVYVVGQALACTNYWYGRSNSTKCQTPKAATLECVTNITTKIPGDDSLFQLQRFEIFLNESISLKQPFFATIQLHTNHLPHPSLPYYYHLYNDTDGNPAGDYLGTLTQMDAAVGALISLLKQSGVFDNTLLWYTADNGPHPGYAGDGQGGIRVKNTATNGLRQCKASVFEGGIRVPGFVSWPRAITTNTHTSVPAYVPDILPTLLDLLNTTHPHPDWALDGVSLTSLLRGNQSFSRPRFLAWRLGSQLALLSTSGQYKLVHRPEAGQCALDPSSYMTHNSTGPFLFDLWADPTESQPLTNPSLMATMLAQADTWEKSISYSQLVESGCVPSAPAPVQLQRNGTCLAVSSETEHAALRGDAPCHPGALNTWAVDPVTSVITLYSSAMVANDVSNGSEQTLNQATAHLAGLVSSSIPANTAASGTTWCFHQDNRDSPCLLGSAVWLGSVCRPDTAVALDVVHRTLVQPGCSNVCVGVADAGQLVLAACGSAAAVGWTVLGGGGARGTYLDPFD